MTTGIVNQAQDILIGEAVFDMYDEARHAWAGLAEDLLDPADTGAEITRLLDVHARFVAMLPAIRDRATRRPAEREYLQAIVRGDIEPPGQEC